MHDMSKVMSFSATNQCPSSMIEVSASAEKWRERHNCLVTSCKLAQKLSTLKATLFRRHLTKEYFLISWKAMNKAICLEHKDQM